jgi:hypothetical protein
LRFCPSAGDANERGPKVHYWDFPAPLTLIGHTSSLAKKAVCPPEFLISRSNTTQRGRNFSIKACSPVASTIFSMV